MRLVVALIIAAFVTLGVPGAGGVSTAEAQVWKIKKQKGAAKTTAKRPGKPTRTARPTMKKKRARKQPKVELVPEETEDADTSTEPADKPREDEEPIFIQVEEISD